MRTRQVHIAAKAAGVALGRNEKSNSKSFGNDLNAEMDMGEIRTWILHLSIYLLQCKQL
jgi:hypothetical protein